VASIITVPFQGDGAGVAQLSWGQREIWAAIRAQQSSLAIGGVAALPVPRDVEDFVAILKFTLSRHQSLRTRLRSQPDGSLRQVLADHGEFPLHVVDVPDDGDPAQSAEDLLAEFRRTEFDYEHEWPCRMGVVRHRGLGTHLVAIYCHFAVDGGGLAALFTDGLDVLFNGGDVPTDPPEVTSLAPFAQVAWQTSPAGQRQNQATRRHWKRQLARVSARRYADTDDERQPRHWQVVCHTPAAYLAVRSVAARTRTETSPVLLAAVAVALAKATGRNPSVLQVVVNNRFRPGLADTVSPIAQTGLCVVDVADITFDEAVDRARRSATSAYLNAYYDPDQMTELIAELGRDRGEDIDLSCFLNDRRRQETRESVNAMPTKAQIRAALADTKLTWGPHSDIGWEPFFCHFDSARDALDLLVQADTRCLPPGDMAVFLHAFESTLVRAAFDPAAMTGVAQPAAVR
jgi:hypothetical protein